MAYPYYLKTIVSGQQVEVYKYKQPIWRDFERSEKKDNKNGVKKEPKQLDILEQMKLKKEKMEFSINRTKTKIRRTVNSNPQLNKFMTLTFAENLTDITKANYIFNQFVKRMVYRFPDFEYLAVPEFQQRGAVHYHLICNVPFIELEGLKYIWGQGIVDIRRITKVANLGNYISKYLGKELFNGKMFNKKKFFRSQTLKQPVELFGYQAMLFINKFLSLIKPSFEKSFKSEWTGEVEYKAYNLDFIIFSKGIFDRSVLSNSS